MTFEDGFPAATGQSFSRSFSHSVVHTHQFENLGVHIRGRTRWALIDTIVSMATFVATFSIGADIGAVSGFRMHQQRTRVLLCNLVPTKVLRK